MVQSKHSKRYCFGIRPSSFLDTDVGTHVVSSSSPPFVCRTSQLDESVAASSFVPSSAGPHLYSAHLDMYRKSIRHPQSAIYIVRIIPAMLVISLSASCVSIGVYAVSSRWSCRTFDFLIGPWLLVCSARWQSWVVDHFENRDGYNSRWLAIQKLIWNLTTQNSRIAHTCTKNNWLLLK
jgi:hypothetical protein